jgi:hypothetical protein
MAAKRARSLQPEQPNHDDAQTAGSKSNLQLNSDVSDQQPIVDALSVDTLALRKEEEDDDEGIEIVEEMTTLTTSLPEPSQPQIASMPSSAQLQQDIIDISDDDDLENRKLPSEPGETLPVASPAFPVWPPEVVPFKAKEPLFLPSPSSSPRSPRSLQYAVHDPLTMGRKSVEIEASWDMPSIDGPEISGQLFSPQPKKKGNRMEAYVLIPPAPDWVRRARHDNSKARNRQNKNRQLNLNTAKHKSWIREEEVVTDSENEVEDIEDWDVEDGTTRRYQDVDTREADGTISPPCFGTREPYYQITII